jgi:hypothetical protein
MKHTWQREFRQGAIVRVRRRQYGDAVPFQGRQGKVLREVVSPDNVLESVKFSYFTPKRWFRVIGLVPGKPRESVDMRADYLTLGNAAEYQQQQQQDREKYGHGRQYRNR